MYDAIVSLTEELSGLINAITAQQSPLFNGVLWGFIIAFLLNTIGIIDFYNYAETVISDHDKNITINWGD